MAAGFIGLAQLVWGWLWRPPVAAVVLGTVAVSDAAVSVLSLTDAAVTVLTLEESIG
jgi:hypothetical protein